MRIADHGLQRIGLVTAGVAAAVTGSIALAAPALAAAPAAGSAEVSKSVTTAADLGLASAAGAPHAYSQTSVIEEG
jgi:hypothetical protein